MNSRVYSLFFIIIISLFVSCYAQEKDKIWLTEYDHNCIEINESKDSYTIKAPGIGVGGSRTIELTQKNGIFLAEVTDIFGGRVVRGSENAKNQFWLARYKTEFIGNIGALPKPVTKLNFNKQELNLRESNSRFFLSTMERLTNTLDKAKKEKISYEKAIKSNILLHADLIYVLEIPYGQFLVETE